MNPFKSLNTDKSKNEKNKLSNDFSKKENIGEKKSIFLKQLITSNSSDNNFSTPSEALGEIFNLLVKIEKQKHDIFLEKLSKEKLKVNEIEKRNKEIIQALSGKFTMKMKEKPIKTISKTSFLKVAIPVGLAAVGTAALANEYPKNEMTQPVAAPAAETPAPRREAPAATEPESPRTTIGEKENVYTGPFGERENLYTGPFGEKKADSKVEEEVMAAAERKAAADRAAAEKAAADREKEQNARENFRKIELQAIRERETEQREQNERIANRRDEEANRNETLRKISPPTPIVPLQVTEPIISGPNPASRPQVLDSTTLDGRKIYSIGDSHGEAVAVMNNKITNMANGGQPSTSPTNYGGTWRGLKNNRRYGAPVGLENIPPNQIVVISQGANDAANSMKAHIDSKGKTPLVSPNKIASSVAKLVSAAQSKGHIVVFMLFPNGPGRGSGLAQYYGGDYQEEVRSAIRGAITVPIIDLNGRPLQPDGIHNTFPAYAAAAKEAVVKIDELKKTKKISDISNYSPTIFGNIDKNIFSISAEYEKLFYEIEEASYMGEQIKNVATSVAKINLPTSNVGDENTEMQNELMNDKPSMFSKAYEMREIIIG